MRSLLPRALPVLVLGAQLAGCGSPAPGASTQLDVRLAHLGFVRALRCAGHAPPKLAARPADWQLRYSRLGADVTRTAELMELTADGRVTLVTNAGVAKLPARPELAARIARLIDATDLLCVSEVPLARVRPAGSYRRSLAVSAPGYAKTMSADACFEVTDRLAWQQVTAALDALVGPGVPAPPGQALLDRACDDGQLAATGELDARERDLLARAGH